MSNARWRLSLEVFDDETEREAGPVKEPIFERSVSVTSSGALLENKQWTRNVLDRLAQLLDREVPDRPFVNMTQNREAV